MNERIASLLERLADEEARTEELGQLSDEDLQGLVDELLDEFRAIRAGERDDVAVDDLTALSAIRDAKSVLEGEQAARAEAAAQEAAEAAQRAEEAAALEAELLGDGEAEEVEETEEQPVEAATEEPAPEVEPVEAATEEPAPKPKSFQRPSLAAMARNRPIEAAPRVEGTKPRWQDISGREYVDELEMAARLAEAINDTAGSTLAPGMMQKIPVVRLSQPHPEEMTLVADDPWENLRRIEAATFKNDPAKRAQAITASGGWCAPGEPRYEIDTIASAERPVRAGLPSMGARRGSVIYQRAPRLSRILANTTAAAVTTWTAGTDESPGGSTKTVQTIDCPDPVTVELDAIVARVQIGNLMGRAFPENIAAFMDLVAARHARVAETKILDDLITLINVDVAETGVVGTARDVKNMLNQAVAQIKSVERASSMQPFQAILAREVLPMVVQDIVLQQASGEVDAVLVDEAWAERLIRTSSATPIFSADVSTGADAFVANSDAGGQNLADYPDTLEVPIFPTGSAVFVDGGTLDLGVTRDSTLNGTNDYQLFMETFEAVAWTGPFGLTVTLTTCPNGESQVATDETGSICSGS